jgi:hypothetical protein
VVDADGLWLVAQDLGTVRGYARCVLTPNAAHFVTPLTLAALSRHAVAQTLQQPLLGGLHPFAHDLDHRRGHLADAIEVEPEELLARRRAHARRPAHEGPPRARSIA